MGMCPPQHVYLPGEPSTEDETVAFHKSPGPGWMARTPGWGFRKPRAQPLWLVTQPMTTPGQGTGRAAGSSPGKRVQEAADSLSSLMFLSIPLSFSRPLSEMNKTISFFKKHKTGESRSKGYTVP